MSLFKKSKKKKNVKKKTNEKIINVNEEKNENVFSKGTRSLKDMIAPSGFDRSDPSYIRVGNKYVRSFFMTGFPPSVGVNWLDEVYNYDGDMDTALYAEPVDERTALEEMTNMITQFQAELLTELEKGSNKKVTKLQDNIDELVEQRRKLEQNIESLFYVQIYSNLYTDSFEELEKETDKFDKTLVGRKIKMTPAYLQQDESYRTALPFAEVFTNDNYRVFNSGSLTSCFPFYNAEVSHDDGIFIGINLATKTPMFLDFYDRDLLVNSNFTIFGTSGSGKSYFVSTITIRSVWKGIRTVIIDPEAEYLKLTHALGGSHVEISAESKTKINPFDIEEEDKTDDYGNYLGEKEVRIGEKVADLLNLIGIMSRGTMTAEQEGLVGVILAELYNDFGITTDPDSLYELDSIFNPQTGVLEHGGIKKEMPTFTDFHNKLIEYSKTERGNVLKPLVNTLVSFKRGNVLGMFDCQTSVDVDFKNAPIITFDVSKLESSVLRPIGMYISLNWTWEKFIKKDLKTKKRIVCDEAWMLVDQNMPGYKYTANFLNTVSRRVRKRNGGLVVASQNFEEFRATPEARAVLSNSSCNILLRQHANDIDGVQEVFKLSDGEKEFLASASKGDLLVKMGNISTVVYTRAFPEEEAIIVPEKYRKN